MGKKILWFFTGILLLLPVGAMAIETVEGGGGAQTVPEPATLLLIGSGIAALWGFRKAVK
jgi:hypothetical protein